MKYKKIVEIVLILLLLICGITLIYYASSKFSGFIIPKTYTFSFESNSGEILNMTAFQLTYDFAQEKGNITFFPSDNPFI